MVSQRVQAVMVALFLLIIIGVVAVLLSRADTDAPRASDPTSDPGEDVDSASKAPVGRVHITAGKSDLVVRFMAGSCTTAGGPKLELSKNQGRSFHKIRIPQIDDGSGVGASSPNVRAIVAADAKSPARLTVAAADESCEVHNYTTTDAGTTWTQEGTPVKEWFVDPKTGGVVSPSGPADAGCDAVGTLAPVTKRVAKVFCTDGAIRATTNGGARWADAGRLTDVSAAVFTGTLTGYAAVAEPDCKSRIYATASGGVSWLPQGCVADAFVIPAMSGSNKRLVAGGSGGVRLSKDGGSTWKPSTME